MSISIEFKKKKKVVLQNFFLQSFEVRKFAKIRHIFGLYLEKNV